MTRHRSRRRSSRRRAHRNYKWHVVAMLWGISFFNYADRQAIFSVFPLLEREMQLTPVQLGLLGSAFAWVYGLGAPLAGMIVDRVSRKSAILGGLYAWSAICMATVASFDFKHLLFWRAAEGLGETFYYPASMSLVSDYHDSRTRSRAMGLHQTSVYIGTIGGGVLCRPHRPALRLAPVLHRLRRPWHPPRPGAAAPARRAAARGGRPRRSRGRRPAGAAAPGASCRSASSSRLVGRTPTLLCLMGAFMCANFVAVVLLSWMPKFLYDRFGMGLAMSGLTATIFVQLASMVGAPIGGWLADAWRRRSPRGRLAVQMVGVLRRRAVRRPVRAHPVDSLADRRADDVGASSRGSTMRTSSRRCSTSCGPEARGTAAGFMNTIGWLAGGGSAPLVIGIIAAAQRARARRLRSPRSSTSRPACCC